MKTDSELQHSITNFQTPEGYKQTELGLIPEDWLIGSLGDFSKGQGVCKDEAKSGGISCIAVACFGLLRVPLQMLLSIFYCHISDKIIRIEKAGISVSVSKNRFNV